MGRKSMISKVFITCIAAGCLFGTGLTASAASADKGATAGKPETLEAKVQRLSDYAEIQDVMSRHAFYYSAGQHDREMTELWAKHTPGTCFGTDDGYWCGYDLVWASYVKYFDHARQRDLDDVVKLHPEIKNTKENWGAGSMMFHSLTTPVIVVAGDRKTAKAIWYSPGYVSQTPNGIKDSKWMWERYGCDFVLEDGHWRMWHFHVYTDFAADRDVAAAGASKGPSGPPAAKNYDADGKELPPGQDATMPKMNAKGTSSGVMGERDWAPPVENPKVPVPYNTFSETFSYGPANDQPEKK